MKYLSHTSLAQASTRLPILALTLIASSILASCGGGSSDPTATGASADSPTVTVQGVSSASTVPSNWTTLTSKVEVINGIAVQPEPASVTIGSPGAIYSRKEFTRDILYANRINLILSTAVVDYFEKYLLRASAPICLDREIKEKLELYCEESKENA